MAVSGRLYSGTKTVTTAVTLDTTAPAVREVLVQADPTNTQNLLIGSSATSTPIVLRASEAITMPCMSTQLIFVAAASGTQTVNWLARE